MDSIRNSGMDVTPPGKNKANNRNSIRKPSLVTELGLPRAESQMTERSQILCIGLKELSGESTFNVVLRGTDVQVQVSTDRMTKTKSIRTMLHDRLTPLWFHLMLHDRLTPLWFHQIAACLSSFKF